MTNCVIPDPEPKEIDEQTPRSVIAVAPERDQPEVAR
jgi:hypothetical protein